MRFVAGVLGSLVGGCAPDAPVRGDRPDPPATVPEPTDPTTSTSTSSTPGPQGTNVLLVVLDDFGTDKLAIYGSTVPAVTPTIDALAAAGVTFDHAYSRPSCSPGRASLQTGRHGRRTGIGTNWVVDLSAVELGLEQVTLPEVVAASPGFTYATSLAGKWHLGSVLGPSGLDHPIRSGWGWYAGAFDNLQAYIAWDKVVDGVLVPTTTYATIDTVDDAIARVEAMPEPWLLGLMFNAPHASDGFLVPEGTPDPGFNARRLITEADTGLGRLLDAIPPETLERTLIVVTGDNGTAPDQAQDPYSWDRAKGSLFDGGVRVPMIVAGAGVEAPGQRSAALVDLVDLFPTIAEIAGVDLATLSGGVDPGAPYAIDGVSLLPLLRDPTLPSPRPYAYSERFEPPGPGPYDEYDRQMLTDGVYKLIRDNLTGVDRFFEYAPGAADEGPDLLPCGLDAVRQAAYDRLSTALAEQTAALVYDAAPFEVLEDGLPLPQDTAAPVCP